MAVSLAPLIATAVILASGSTLVLLNPQAADDVVPVMPAVVAHQTPQGGLEEGSPISDRRALVDNKVDQLPGDVPASNVIDLTDAADLPDHGAGKIEQILALQRQVAWQEKPAPGNAEVIAIDLTGAEELPDHGASLIAELARLQAMGADVIAR